MTSRGCLSGGEGTKRGKKVEHQFKDDTIAKLLLLRRRVHTFSAELLLLLRCLCLRVYISHTRADKHNSPPSQTISDREPAGQQVRGRLGLQPLPLSSPSFPTEPPNLFRHRRHLDVARPPPRKTRVLFCNKDARSAVVARRAKTLTGGKTGSISSGEDQDKVDRENK